MIDAGQPRVRIAILECGDLSPLWIILRSFRFCDRTLGQLRIPATHNCQRTGFRGAMEKAMPKATKAVTSHRTPYWPCDNWLRLSAAMPRRVFRGFRNTGSLGVPKRKMGKGMVDIIYKDESYRFIGACFEVYKECGVRPTSRLNASGTVRGARAALK